MTVPCQHPRTGIVTSRPLGGIEGGPHAAAPVCNRAECIEEATEWVVRMSHAPAFHVLDEAATS